MADLSAILDARAQLDSAQEELRAAAKLTINEIVTDILTNNDDIENIVWAQRSSEYNDEGMYPGVFGPIINIEEGDQESWYEGPIYDMLYDYRGKGPDPRLADLQTALVTIDDEILSEIFGDEYIVVATLRNGSVDYETEYAGV